MMENKKQIRANNKLPNYYKIVVNTRTGYTKLVKAEKALELIYGKMTINGTRDHVYKDIYQEVDSAINRQRNHTMENKD